jgi:RNA polymerase sigma-70 factor, ECF subfamily
MGDDLPPTPEMPMAEAMSLTLVMGAPRAAPARVAVVDPTEAQLIERAIAGDSAAFTSLVRSLQGRVFGLALRLLNDRGEAEDLTQEVFVVMHHHLHEFRGDAKLSTWMHKITRNRALNRLKFLKRRHVGTTDELIDDTAHDNSRDGRPSVLENKQLQKRLEQELLRLPEEQRVLVVLRDLEELSYEEIAAETGLPLGTVKSRLHRARMELAQRLRPQGDAL